MRGLGYWEKRIENARWLKENLKELHFEIDPVLIRKYDEQTHMWIKSAESEQEFDVKFPLGFFGRIEMLVDSAVMAGIPWEFNFLMLGCSKLLVQYSPCPRWNRSRNQNTHIDVLGMGNKEQVMDFCVRLRTALAAREHELEKCIITFALCLQQWNTPRDIRKMILRRSYAEIRKGVLKSIA
jgi:hypothetical protein